MSSILRNSKKPGFYDNLGGGIKLILFTILLVSILPAFAQNKALPEYKGSTIGLKTNIPYWGTATFNLGAEARLAEKWTFEIEAGLNPFSGKNDDGSYGKSMRHLRIHPEIRYWFCEAFHQSFIGLHLPYILYNVSDIKLLGTEGERHQGWGTGVGVSYGYQWLLHKHWNLEATLGVGYLYFGYDRFPCTNCGNKQTDNHKHYFGPTQAAVSLIYMF